MSLPWQSNGLRFSANMGLSPGVQPIAQPPPDPRTQYTGGLSYSAPLAYGQAGNPNNKNGQGPTVAPQAAPHTMSELGAYPMFSGYQNMNPVQNVNPSGAGQPNLNITQLQPFKQTGFANLTNKLAAAQPTGVAAPHPTEPGRNFWGGGFGKSDNSAWGNALGPVMENQQGTNALQTAAYQPQGHTNQALPPGYGSVFGLRGT